MIVKKKELTRGRGKMTVKKKEQTTINEAHGQKPLRGKNPWPPPHEHGAMRVIPGSLFSLVH